MTSLHKVQVFVDQQGKFGNPLMVQFGTLDWTNEQCLQLARTTGTSETVFVDEVNSEQAVIRIFSPSGRMAFAGHPCIGTGWLLHRLGYPVAALQVDAGQVQTEANETECTVLALAAWSKPWHLIPCATPSEVDTASAAGENRHDYCWAWADQPTGRVRARAFTSASGTAEDEATGSAAMWLCRELGVPLAIRQGQGSVLHAEPLGEIIRLSGQVKEA